MLSNAVIKNGNDINNCDTKILTEEDWFAGKLPASLECFTLVCFCSDGGSYSLWEVGQDSDGARKSPLLLTKKTIDTFWEDPKE